MRLLATLAILAAPTFGDAPAFADAPNLAVASEGAPGPASTLSMAQRLYAQAIATADTTALLTAIRLARSITVRPASGWTVETTALAPKGEPQGASAPVDPAGAEAIGIVRAFAGEDPSLQDLVYELDAQRPEGQRDTVAAAMSNLAAGQTDTWRIAFFGMSPAELAVIGDGDTSLVLIVADTDGNPVCTRPAANLPLPCAFTPARNGFFTVRVTNLGTLTNSYRLLSN